MNPRSFAWLGFLGAMVVLAIAGGIFASVPAAAFVILGLYATALGISVLGGRQTANLLDQTRDSLNDAAIARRQSPEAREATTRARSRGGDGDGLSMLDVGLITTQAAREGVTIRRTRAISLDEDGVRPFVTLEVEPRDADRNVIVRFEMIDAGGQTQFVHEQKVFLRDGQMNILSDHHLPLANNPRLSAGGAGNAGSVGDWDLRVLINGNLLGAHSFSVTPSIDVRFGTRGASAAYDLSVDEQIEYDLRQRASQTPRRDPAARLRDDPTPSRRVVSENDEPTTLEELLRRQNNSGSGRS